MEYKNSLIKEVGKAATNNSLNNIILYHYEFDPTFWVYDI